MMTQIKGITRRRTTVNTTLRREHYPLFHVRSDVLNMDYEDCHRHAYDGSYANQWFENLKEESFVISGDKFAANRVTVDANLKRRKRLQGGVKGRVQRKDILRGEIDRVGKRVGRKSGIS